MKLEVGAKVWLKPLGNAAIYSKSLIEEEIIEEEIIKLGRKYFETNSHGRYYIDNLLQDAGEYSPNYKAYLDIQEYRDELEKRELLVRIEGSVRKATLDQLRAIHKILNTQNQ